MQSTPELDCLALFVYFKAHSIITEADLVIASITDKLFNPPKLERILPYLLAKGNLFNPFSSGKGDFG